MTLSHRYQNFGVKNAPQLGDETSIGAEKIEEDKLQSFENGYQSGWDDAVAAQGTTRENVTAEFARNLQEASFSFHEARTALLRELQSTVEPIINELLPGIAGETIALHILDQISKATKEALELPIEIVVSPSRVSTLQTLFEDVLKEPFEIIEDATLGEDQVFLRLGQKEKEIDFAPWLGQVKDALSTHFESIGKG